MWHKLRIPDEIRSAFGRTVQAATQLDGGTWLAATHDVFAVMEPKSSQTVAVRDEDAKSDAVVHGAQRELVTYEWSQFARGSYKGEEQKLTLTFVDPCIEPLEFVMSGRDSQRLIRSILERIDYSIVYQQFAELPSGTTVHGQVRRRVDGTFFSQIPWYEAQSDADAETLDQLAREMLDAVGLH